MTYNKVLRPQPRPPAGWQRQCRPEEQAEAAGAGVAGAGAAGTTAAGATAAGAKAPGARASGAGGPDGRQVMIVRACTSCGRLGRTESSGVGTLLDSLASGFKKL